MTQQTYTATDAAKALGISRSTITRMITEGEIRTVQIRGRKRIPATEITRIATPDIASVVTAPAGV